MSGNVPAASAGLGAARRRPIGRDGRFRIEGPGSRPQVRGTAVQGFRGIGNVYRDVTVGPGEVKDLGDLKVVPPKPNSQP